MSIIPVQGAWAREADGKSNDTVLGKRKKKKKKKKGLRNVDATSRSDIEDLNVTTSAD